MKDILEHEENLYDEVKMVREFTCSGDEVSVGEGCETVVTA